MLQKNIDVLESALSREKTINKQLKSIYEQQLRELTIENKNLKNVCEVLEQSILKKDSQLQGVFESIVDAYVIMDLSGNILKMNDAALDLFGFESHKIDINLMSLVEFNDRDKVLSSFRKIIKQGYITNFEIKINTIKKIEKLVHINANLIYDDGIAVAAHGIIRDITKEKEAESKLIESENRLSTLILNLDSGVILEDENRKIVLTNRKFTEFFNIDAAPEELIGMDCKMASEKNSVLFKNPEAFLNRMQEIHDNKQVVIGDELEMIDGKILERNYMPILQGDESKGYLWTFKDITINRTYHKSLEIEKFKYQSIISNMKLGLVEVDTNDVILMVNQSFIDMTGYSENELVGIKGKDLLPIKEDQALMDAKVNERKIGKTESYELRIHNKEGALKHWLVSGAPNYDLEGNVIGSIGINLDISEIKKLENQKESLLNELAKSNNELQEYAHIVSHDLKSPLRSINALVSWIKEDNKDILDAASNQNLNLIENTLEKMDQLISDILDYSTIGSDTDEVDHVNLNNLLEDLLKILYIPEQIKITIVNTLPIISGHKTKLQQLFQNLISNAIKFNDKDNGFINISVEELEDYYQFSVQDNGIGIEKQFHDKIFKVFHSLKKSKDSTGIGLSIVQKIVELHNGKIWLTSEFNVGTTFYFTLKK